MAKPRSPARAGKKRAAATPFYYAEGKRVALAEDRRYRVLAAGDLDRLVPSEAGRRQVRERARPLTAGLLLVDLGALPAEIAAALRSDPSLPAIFRYGRELIHVLPEIAVASSDPASLAAARELLAKLDAEIEEKRGDELIVRLPAGSGAETLALASRLVEEAHMEMAQPRFLRIVPRPKPRS